MTFKTDLKNYSLPELFTHSPILSELVKKVEQLTQLNLAVHAQVEPELAQHCRVTRYHEGILTLTTPSSVWGHTLRFSKVELLSALRTHPEWRGLKSIRILVHPLEDLHSIPPTPSPFQSPVLTQNSAECLKKSAELVTSAPLKKALLKLASRAELSQ